MKFTKHVGIAAPMLRINIDTDAIIPSREMKRVSKSGLGESLFAAWRYIDRGKESEKPDPGFILNQADYANASILLTGHNMGCGSSREFAVWALTDFGIRAIIAPSFGDIFYRNCIRNGLLPVVIDEARILALAGQVDNDPGRQLVGVDLSNCVVLAPNGESFPFDIEPLYRKMLLEGLDEIDLTLESIDEIDAYCKLDRKQRGWAHLS